MAPQAKAMVFNIVVHHADLAEALGAAEQSPELWAAPVVEAQRRHWSTLPLRLTTDPEPDDPAATVPVDGYVLSRALFTRLSRARVDEVTAGG